MDKDILLKRYLSHNDRYADLINGFAFGGKTVVLPEDLTEMDTQSLLKLWPFKRDRGTQKQGLRYRDLIKKAAFGINFAVIGIENQSEVDYLMPLRVMTYDLSEYQRQVSAIKRIVRKKPGIGRNEFLSGFEKTSRLKPCITIVVFYGKDWDGSREMHELIDFSDISDSLHFLIGNYGINLLEIKKHEDTTVFQTDLKQVFDFIRNAENKKKLHELVTGDAAYNEMDTEAFDVLATFTKADELLSVKEYYEEGGRINMCKALTELIEDGRVAGREEGIRALILDNLEEGVPRERIVFKLEKRFHLDEEKALEYVQSVDEMNSTGV